MAQDIEMPALGESVTEGTVSRWLKKVGDQVAVDEPLLEVSTDKVDSEVPSPISGVLSEILVEEDETVDVGTVLCRIGDGSAMPESSPSDTSASSLPGETPSAPSLPGTSSVPPAPKAPAAPAAPPAPSLPANLADLPGAGIPSSIKREGDHHVVHVLRAGQVHHFLHVRGRHGHAHRVRGDAAVPDAAVILVGGSGYGRVAAERQHAGHGDAGHVRAAALEAVLSDDATHAPRGHLHAVKGQRHGQADEIQRVVGVVLRHFGIIVVRGAQPEQVRTHVFGELVADGDARAVSVEDRGTDAGKVRQRILLEAHANLGVGLRDGPVDIAVTNLDFLAVRAEGRALSGLAPVLVPDFKEQDHVVRS